MSRNFKGKLWILRWIFLLAIVALFARYVAAHKENLAVFGNVKPFLLVALVLLAVIFKLCWGVLFKTMLDPFKIYLKFHEWFGLTSSALMLNYVLPAKGGMLPVVYYLKKKYGLSYMAFMGYNAVFYFFTFFMNALVGVLLVLWHFGLNGILSNKLFIFLGFGLLAMIAALVVVFVLHGTTYFRNVPFVERIRAGISIMVADSNGLLRISVLQLMLIILVGLRYWAAYSALGINIGLVPALIIAMITSFSFFVGLTPASLGFKETFMVLSSVYFGVSVFDGIMVSVLDRAVDMILSAVMGLPSYCVLTHKGFAVVTKETEGVAL